LYSNKIFSTLGHPAPSFPTYSWYIATVLPSYHKVGERDDRVAKGRKAPWISFKFISYTERQRAELGLDFLELFKER
jgi:hypothetical protein